ncbi:MAG: O-methyltransferase [Roseiarcus sp.]|uniref:O-methyltransferase n=1 Tax=Roseiarcus sp. TaxID=1969460 RepID=UPI003BAE99B6
MSERGWRAVDSYFNETIVGRDSVLEATLKANAAAGLPSIDVSPAQGKMLTLLARVARAEKALEIGTLGGYSTICIARALPREGRLLSIEYSDSHAKVARANIARAGLADRVEVRAGAALDILPAIEAERLGPFDFVFIDADKSNNANYLGWALRLSRPGTTIIVDNVVRDGRIADASAKDPDVTGTRRMFEMMAREPRLQATAIQTVGDKGWDGFALAVVE